MIKIGETLITMRNMVDSFVSRHYDAWEKVRNDYREKHGYFLGTNLSMQSYIGSDLTIDMAYLAKDIEERGDFVNEYWIRSQGIQCIRNEKDRNANTGIWSDILGKFVITKKGDEITYEWFQDDDCLVENTLIKDDRLFDRWF